MMIDSDPKRNRRFKGRTGAALAAVAVLFVWGSTAHTVLSDRRDVLRDARKTLENEAALLGETASRTFWAADQFLRHVADHYAAEPTALDLDRLLTQSSALKDIVVAVQIVDNAGRSIRTSQGARRVGVVTLERAIEAGEHGASYSVGTPGIGLDGPNWTIPISRPLQDASGRSVAVALAHLRAAHFAELFRGNEGTTRLEMRLRGGTPLVVLGISGTDEARLSVTKPATQAPIAIVAERNRKDVMAAWLARAYAEGAKAVGATGAILAAAFFVGRRRRSTDRLLGVSPMLDGRYAAATRALSDGLFEWHLASGTIRFSAQFMTTVGLTNVQERDAAAAVGALLHPDDRKGLEERIGAFIKSDRFIVRNTYRLRHRGGDYRRYEIRLVAERDANGRADRLIGSIVERSEGQAGPRDAAAGAADTGLAEILDALSDGYLIYDAEDRLVHCSARYRAMYPDMAKIAAPGITFDEMCRAFIERGVVDPAPLTKDEWIAHRMAQHRSPPFSAVNKIGDGRWILRREQKLPGGGTITVHSDITEQKREAATIEERSRLLGTSLDHIGQGVGLYDANGKLTFANRRYGELLDIPPHLLLPGTPGIDIVRHFAHTGEYGEGDTEDIVKSSMDMFANWPRPFLYERTRPNGMTVQTHIVDLPDGGSMVTIADVSERKRHESENENQRARLQAIIANAPIGIAVFDRAERLVVRNAAYLRMATDNDVDAAIGTTMTQLVKAAIDRIIDDPTARADELARRLKDIRRPPPHVSERTYRDKRIMEVHTGGLPDGGMIRFYVDVTERRRMEKLKSEFVSTVSHELRTPLTSIAGSLGLLAGGVAGELPDKAKNLLAMARANSDRLVRLVGDILDMEKIASGRLEFRSEPRPLGPIVGHAVETNKGYADRYGVRIDIANEAPNAVAVVDEDRLHQVLTNLLSNAIKFSPGGGSVAVRLADAAEHGWRIEVADRGPGIPDEFRSRIFEPFAQADGTDARRLGGTGLGLSIAKSIVERMGGRIGYDTVPGRGTRFFVDLPKLKED